MTQVGYMLEISMWSASRIGFVCTCFAVGGFALKAQIQLPGSPVEPVGASPRALSQAEIPQSSQAGRAAPGNYVLGPGDEVAVKALDFEEFNGFATRVDNEGNIRLPYLGRLHAGGETVEQLEGVIRTALKRYVLDPDVFIFVLSFRSQPVTILGAVTAPGVHQLEGHKTLFEVISEVGGLRQDAGYTIKITRQRKWGKIPLPATTEDPNGDFYIGEVSARSVMEVQDPTQNIQILPNDIISVPRGKIVYVIGAVHRSGGYVLGDSESITVLQALALADGLDPVAKSSKAKILRVTPGSTLRTEIPLDVKKIFAGKGTDVALGGEDILFIPVSGAKRSLYAVGQSSLGLITAAGTTALYRAY